MNEHLNRAIEIYEQHGIDFQKLLTWHLCHGIVVSDMHCFAICFSCNKEDPTKPVHMNSGDTLFVTFATGDIKNGFQKYIQDYEFVAFQRSFKRSDKIKVHDMYKFYSKLKER